MATYYVDFVNGLDANNGLGPDASAATNKPWKTLTKLLGAAGMASGDTAYLSPAGPFRETVSVAMTSAVAETKVIGDPQNAQGFKTSGGVAVAPGPVIHTAYTTNDKTAPSATALMTLNARDFLTFEKILFVGGITASMFTCAATSTNITFNDCSFLAGNSGYIVFDVTTAFATALNWVIDRCLIMGPCYDTSVGPSFILRAPLGAGADYDVNVIIRNTMILGGGVYVPVTGAGANKPGGIKIRNCTSFFSALLHCATGASSLTTPCTVNNCLIMGGGSYFGLVCGAVGQITENYNLLVCRNPRSNVTAGANSISNASYSHLVHFGQERSWGSPLFKPLFQPMQGSPVLGFGNDGTQTATDLLNLQRPAGAGSALPAVGIMERHNNWITDPSPIGSTISPIKITGPGDQAFLVPVPASAVTISVVVKWDATYAGTKPQLQLDANGDIGVTAQTVTATGGSGSNETLTLASFTPTKARRMVTVRVKSNDTNGAGVVQSDNFTVTV